jgi:hypothetical protein
VGVLDSDTIRLIDRKVAAGRRWFDEVALRRSDGTLRQVVLSVTPVQDPVGAVTSVVTVFHDVTELRTAQTEVELQARIRAALAESLHTIPDGASLEQTAQLVCDELARLPFVDVAEIELFTGTDDVQILAVSGPPGYPLIAGSHLPPVRAAVVRERAATGPWAQYVTPDPATGSISGAPAAGLKALAYGPITHGGHLAGCLVVGTFDSHFARTIVEQMPAVVSFTATTSALLAERLHVRQREAELRHALEALLTARAFHPVFQSIVDLATGETMGYEALTRFDSGQRPDLCFADAWSVGLGPQLELATLEAAVAAGKELPAGTWLDLNVSPRLIADPGRLREILWSADRASSSRSPSTSSSGTTTRCARRSGSSATTSASRSTTRGRGSPTSATSSTCAPTS